MATKLKPTFDGSIEPNVKRLKLNHNLNIGSVAPLVKYPSVGRTQSYPSVRPSANQNKQLIAFAAQKPNPIKLKLKKSNYGNWSVIGV